MKKITVTLTMEQAFAIVREGKSPEYMSGYALVCAMHARKQIEKAISRGTR